MLERMSMSDFREHILNEKNYAYSNILSFTHPPLLFRISFY